MHLHIPSSNTYVIRIPLRKTRRVIRMYICPLGYLTDFNLLQYQCTVETLWWKLYSNVCAV